MIHLIKAGRILLTVGTVVLPLLPAKPIVIALQALLLLKKKV